MADQLETAVQKARRSAQNYLKSAPTEGEISDGEQEAIQDLVNETENQVRNEITHP